MSPIRKRRRSWLRTAGWALILLGIITSWVWSVELALAGAVIQTSLAGAATFVLFGCGVALLWRASPHRGRRTRVIYSAALVGCALAAITAGVFPGMVAASSTGWVTTEISSESSESGYRLSDVANISSDSYGLTSIGITVHATDHVVPELEATVSFTDGTSDLSCSSTRTVWTHYVSTVELMCGSFTPIASLRAISAITVVEK